MENMYYALMFYRLHVTKKTRCEDLPHVTLYKDLEEAQEVESRLREDENFEVIGLTTTGVSE